MGIEFLIIISSGHLKIGIQIAASSGFLKHKFVKEGEGARMGAGLEEWPYKTPVCHNFCLATENQQQCTIQCKLVMTLLLHEPQLS